MTKLTISILAATVLIVPAFAVDGTILINQSTVLAAGGFPYHITQTGSYRLSGNVIAASTGAIVISGSNVTLDLNGFSIGCVGCSGVTGISSSGIVTVIMNGTVDGFLGTGGIGISFQAAAGKVDHMTVNTNTTGVATTGADLTIAESNVSGNGTGVTGPSSNLTIRNSVISNNGQDGIEIGTGLVTGSMITGNGFTGASTRGGIVGFAGPVSVTNNVIANNAVFGIGIAQGATGIVGFGLNTIVGNTVDLSGAGFVKSMNNNVCSSGSC